MHIFNNLEETAISWKVLTSQFIQCKTDYLCSSTIIKTKFRIYKSPLKKCVGLHDFTDELYQTSRQGLATFLHNLFQKIEQKGIFSHIYKDNITFTPKPDRS